MAQFGTISTRGRAVLLLLATSGTVLGAGVARSLIPAAAATATSVQLTTTTPTVVPGHSAVLKATVTSPGGKPGSGTVTFFLDGAPVTPASNGTKSLTATHNSASTNVTLNALGAHQLTAQYNGSPAFAASPMSSPVTINVVQVGTGVAAVTIASSLGTTVPSATPITLTAHVAGTPVPTGSVSFTDSLTSLPSNRALTAGAVGISVASLPLGTNNITANYSGDGTYAPASGTLTITVTAQPNDKYLIHLYTDMIGAQDASGEAFWASQMSKGLAHSSVTYAFTQTLAYDNAVVAQLYQNIMQRPASADPNGANFWAGKMRGGLTPEQIAASMVASDERFASPSFGNNDIDTFIAATYQALLGRSDTGDPGAAFWHDYILTGHPRWELTLGFVHSPEWASVTVRNMYTKFHLGTPDPGALGYWASQVVGGMSDAQLAADLTASQQYYDWTQAN